MADAARRRPGEEFEPLIDVQTRYWFNPAAISQHFIIPGAVTIIMTVIGAILTSLVIAREWERAAPWRRCFQLK